MRGIFNKLFSNHLFKELTLFAIALAVVYFSWYGNTLYPVRVFAVFFHETSHALTAIFTGGSISEFVVNPNISGHVRRMGGNDAIVISAGYIGTSLWGCLFYILAAKTHLDRWVVAAIGVFVGFLTIYFPAGGYTLFFGIVFTIGLLILGRFASVAICDMALRITAIVLMIRPVFSLYFGIIKYGIPRDVTNPMRSISDAHNMAKKFGATPSYWAWIWIVIICVAIILTLAICWQKPKMTKEPLSPQSKPKKQKRSLGDMV